MSDIYTPTILHGSNQQGARFGSSIVIGGDLDQNGYDDVIIGAPYENLSQKSSGAVYVYYVTSAGLSENSKQVRL